MEPEKAVDRGLYAADACQLLRFVIKTDFIVASEYKKSDAQGIGAVVT